MSTDEIQLPIVDLSDYIASDSVERKEKVIAQIRDACKKFGFFQLTGHGIPLKLQHALFKSLDRLFKMPTEEKLKLSYLENLCRRGYEASGMSMRDGDLLPDSKEVQCLSHMIQFGAVEIITDQMKGLLYRPRGSSC